MSDEERGLFRGSEFPKMLILAGLLLVGWPAIFYFGFFARMQQKVEPAPIANLTPLPPPDAAPEFAGLIDKTPRTIRDDAALELLFKRVRNEPDRLSKEARREVLPIDLLLKPNRYRGLPIRMEGFAQQVYAHDNEDRELTPTGRFYEIWFRSDERKQGTYPCCVFVEDVPKTLPGGRNLEERVALEGYFLRLYGYQAGDKLRFAPLLIGRITHAPDAPAPSRQPQTRLWMGVIIGALFTYLSLRFLFSLLRTRVRPPSTSFTSSKDNIEPEELDRWLDQTEDDDEHDDCEES